MPRKNRGYKKGEPFRDSRLFVIACEGEKREKEYFDFFAQNNRRIKIKLLVPENEEQGKSAPKWVFDRAARFEAEFGLNKFDQLWLVMDVDNWLEVDLRKIGQQCVDTQQWNIAISNPCFELWLLLHLIEIDQSKAQTCSALKRELHHSMKGGYKVERFVPLIEKAIENAVKLEDDSTYFFPNKMETKVHHLAVALLGFDH